MYNFRWSTNWSRQIKKAEILKKKMILKKAF